MNDFWVPLWGIIAFSLLSVFIGGLAAGEELGRQRERKKILSDLKKREQARSESA